MNDKILHMDPEQIISRYLAGEATDEEVRWLEDWVLASEENRQIFLASRKTFNLFGYEESRQFDDRAAWQRIQKSISDDQEEKKGSKIHDIGSRRFRIWQVAAAAIILVAIGMWYLNSTNDYRVKFGAESTVLVNELPDGSIISLNRHSKISYEKKDNRRVKLSGDAFFEVKRDEDHPFIVEADQLRIQVLGTSFYVNTKADESKVNVMVRSGRVGVYFKQDSLILAAGQSAVFDKRSKSLVKSAISDINYLSWKTKTLVFEDMDLGDVVEKINQVYDSQIILDNEKLEVCKITVTFKQQELDAILSVIAETLDLRINQKDSEIVLSGPECN